MDDSLLMLLDEVRSKTLRVLDGLDDDRARWAPPGLQNSCLWHAGHSYVVVESLSAKALGQDPVLPDGWFELFSWESRPAEVPPERWPSLAEVAEALRSQHERLRGLIAGLSVEQLGAPAPGASTPSRYGVLHGLHDEARHSGEISMLRKLMTRTFADQAP